MPRPSKLILLPVMLFVAVCLDVGPGVGQQIKPTPKTGVSASETMHELSPLDSSLAPGKLFDKEKCSALLIKDHSTHWNKLPAWLVGTWTSRDEQSEDEGKTAHLEYWAICRIIVGLADKTGQVWSHYTAGEWAQGVDGSRLDCYLGCTESSPSPDEYRSEFESISFQLDGLSHLIQSCSRRLTEDTYYLISPGVVRLKEVHRNYDWRGHQLDSSEREWNLLKSGEFASDLTQTTGDSRPHYPLFVQFLRDNGMTDRIPDAPPAAP
ncbi:MAG: hypothetical protein JSS86_09110 [Cyanobacteria bacterium SZAS LIN-2]|nr:hypothetical protein [Cyanobacteria bacterium SZAS LIN-3]MBS1996456.1 hypothetical protein [Cyanobacteria bacterium SZAS LIN-2]